MKIEELLHRRSDLSTFLVHLTRADGATSAKDQLKSILTAQTINATSAFGQAVPALKNAQAATTSQNAVCFTETPLEYVSLLTEQITGRRCQFEPYGVAITRKQARRRAVNPVWYLDITPGHTWLTQAVDGLVSAAIAAPRNAQAQGILELTPFIEQMGSGASTGGGGYRKEFWWEREWRHVGNFGLPSPYLVLCPEADFAEMALLFTQNGWPAPRMFDPSWSLEQIIGGLAGFQPGDLGPM